MRRRKRQWRRNPHADSGVRRPPLPSSVVVQVELTTRFEKDFARRIAGTPLDAEFEALLALLMEGAPLPTKYRDHPLKGTRVALRDCHLRPDMDMVLIYQRTPTALKLIRIGTHADLFG